MRTTDFQPGMTIFSRDGMALGRIQEIWVQTPSHGTLPVSQYLLQDFGPVRGTCDLLSSSSGYLHIQDGNWLSGPRNDMYIPLAAVKSIDAPSRATLKAPAEICRRSYDMVPQPVRQAA